MLDEAPIQVGFDVLIIAFIPHFAVFDFQPSHIIGQALTLIVNRKNASIGRRFFDLFA